MRQKSKKEVEDIAFRALREHSDRSLLSNKCVDCYVHGFQKSQDMQQKALDSLPGRIDDWMESLKDRIKYLDDCAGYSGRAPSEAETAESNVLGDIYRALSAIKEGNSFKKYIEIAQKKQQCRA